MARVSASIRAAPALDREPWRADAPDQGREAAIGAEMANSFLRHVRGYPRRPGSEQSPCGFRHALERPTVPQCSDNRRVRA